MALNPDAIPTSEQVRETLLDRFYYPYQKQIWLACGVLSLAIVAFLGIREVRQRRYDEQWTRYNVAREAGRENVNPSDPDAARRGADERITVLQRLVKDYPDDLVTPWAMNAIVTAQVEAGRYDEALQTLAELRSKFKDYPLNTESVDTASGGARRSLAERMEALIRDEKDWAVRSAYVHPQPTSKSLALVETTAGSFWIGFYEEQAPAHAANFIALAKSGYFNGTQVYQVRTGGTPDAPTPLAFEAGSAASRFEGPDAVRDPSAHDQDEPLATIDSEDSRSLIKHRRGVVSAVVQASGESAHRFMVVAAANGLSRYDGQNTPFAMVLEREASPATVDLICRSTTFGTHPETKADPDAFRMRDHPNPYIWIRRVSIWRDEKLEAGHTWDTSRAGTAQPEPWEATLPAPVKPSEFAPKAPTPPK
jgi:cyclophilin family peptidyl-prolyl cis-trans isomerase